MGMKTGFVCASGFNLVSAAERGGRTLIAVVFGATSGADRTLKAAQLLDQGFGVGGGFFGRGASSGARTLEALTASYETRAPNRRAAICGKGRAPASEEDSGGSISLAASPMADNADSIMNPGRGFYSGGEAAGVGARVGRRISLGPRAPLEAIEVRFGREPGSTAVARRPNGMGEAQAFAGEPKRGKANPLALTEPMNRPAQAARIGGGKQQPLARPAGTASLHAAGKAKANAPKVQAAKASNGKAEAAKARPKAAPKGTPAGKGNPAGKAPPSAKAAPKARQGT
jgi:D-alanyl-D-alanine carboxypeptidase